MTTGSAAIDEGSAGLTVTVVVLGMPDPKLDANAANGHFLAKAKYIDSDRRRGGWAVKDCLDADARTLVGVMMRSRARIPYRVTIGLSKGAKRRDTDNAVIWTKALRDGIADVLCDGWDGNWDLIETTQVRDRDGSGFVRFVFELGDS